MSKRKHSFEVDGPPRIDVRIRSGDVTLKASSDDAVTVQLSGDTETVELTSVDATHDSVSVRSRPQKQRWFSKSMDVSIAAPAGGVVRVNLGAGDVIVRVPLDSLDVNVGSGNVRIDESVDEIRVKVASGDVSVRDKTTDATIVSASGDIRVSEVDEISVSTGSGSVILGAVAGTARIKSASGDLKIHDFSGPELVIKTMSGDVTVGLAPGKKIEAKISAVSGELRNRIKPSGTDPTGRMKLVVKSFSGDVTLRSPW